MPPSKNEVMQELRVFMHGFARSVARIYGDSVVGPLRGVAPEIADDAKPDDCHFDDTSFWSVVDAMYDFGIAGYARGRFGDGKLDGDEADVDLFFNSLPAMDTFLAEDFVLVPHKVIRCVKTGVARHILEGGERYADLEQQAIGDSAGTLLTLREVALLADMDERSVRNACNPKLPEALKTIAVGKRTLVEPAAAKTWLSGRKGYAPLRKHDKSSPAASMQRITVDLPKELAQQLLTASRACNLTLDEYLARRIQA